MKNPRLCLLVLSLFVAGQSVYADPCGMVPPLFLTGASPIQRVGVQKTYVFYKQGVETFVIRPGYRGNVDNFGMLIPFPTPPEIRKVSDNIFAHIAAAIDPPEVVVDLRPRPELYRPAAKSVGLAGRESALAFDLAAEVVVLRQEAVGMYEVAVLEAGSAAALQKWMDDHGYQYPKGMDSVCEEYVNSKWCFVAVKTRVGNKGAIDPRPGMREADATLPTGSSFDGNVQAMGFRFRTDEFVVPMRLSAFNEGETRNAMYVLSDQPLKINNIPEQFIMRQMNGEQLLYNITKPLPLRIIGGGYNDIPDWRRQGLAAERDPKPRNGLAKDLFASDLLAVSTGILSHEFEEKEKELLRISERLNLRGGNIDDLHAKALEKQRASTIDVAIADLRNMTLTVVDGDFPREVISRENLTFSGYTMDASKNRPSSYEANTFGPKAPVNDGTVYKQGGMGPLPIGVFLWICLGALALLVVHATVGRRLATARARGNAAKRVSMVLALMIPMALLSSTVSAQVARDSVVQTLINRLGDPERSESASQALIALGEEAVADLFAQAIDGNDPATRGWAIVCLGEIGGERVDRRLIAIQSDARQPELVRTWAAAARVTVAASVAQVADLGNLVAEFPALARSIEKKLTGLLQDDHQASVAKLIALSLQIPQVQQALAPRIIAAGADALFEVMTTSLDANIRRQAAAYMGSLAAQGGTRVAEVVIKGYEFDVKAQTVPWSGGALFVPGIVWKAEHGRALTENLIKWLVFCDQRNLTQQKTQIHNNLRSVGLAAVAGYQSPGWHEASVPTWLTVWKNAAGLERVAAILSEQGVSTDPRYQGVLQQ